MRVARIEIHYAADRPRVPKKCPKCEAPESRFYLEQLEARLYGADVLANGEVSHGSGGELDSGDPALGLLGMGCQDCGHVLFDAEFEERRPATMARGKGGKKK